ncbi:putative elongator complex protein 1 [Periplaneta americana]|uniref:putative elongator complex protein 1 n=1 Tax=Periplaneta americana TaxID=6978 RepID=UPI0037E8A000
MKNLFLYQYIRNDYPILDSVNCFCVSAHSKEVFVYSEDIIYRLSNETGQLDTLFRLEEYYDKHIPALLDISFNSVTACLCLAFGNGDVLTYDSTSNEIQCVGCVESGLKSVKWSPDQELIVMVTGQNTIIIMTATFDPITEVDLLQSGFGEKQFVTVGWGRKETQFHGSEGKAAARAVSKPVVHILDSDDGLSRISWRGDGSLFAVNMVHPESNSRCIRIFSRDGILQYTSEPSPGLEGLMSWRPSGNLIACSLRLPNKHVIAFFEKNGLRHGEFSLSFATNDYKLKSLSWNSESSILAVWCEFPTGKMCLQLWTVNNYHWYLKQSLMFPSEKKLLAIEWDIQRGNRLHVICEGLCYICYDWAWITNSSHGGTDSDGAFVAVIDGAKILLTSFRRGIIPPPLCSQILQVALPVNSIMFAPPNRKDRLLDTEEIAKDENNECRINSNTFCAVLCDGTIIPFTQSSSDCHVQLTACSLDGKNAAEFHHWLWIKEDTLLCCYTVDSVSSLLDVSFDLMKGNIHIRKEISVGGIVSSVVLIPDGSGAVVQLTDGNLFLYKLDHGNIVHYPKSLPEACETMKVFNIDGKDVVLGLSSRNRLYVDGQEVANNVTSMAFHSEFILLTTLRHTLLCAQLNWKGLQCLINGKCGPGRRIERGARLVTSVAGDTRVILQMPRGNLECIQPRALTLHVAAVHLDEGRYGEAFQLLRKQRINLNLLCDHKPTEFLSNMKLVINELKDPSWLSLFLSELQEENITHSMYKEYYEHLDCPPTPLSNKVKVICDGMREAMLCQQDENRYLLPILTSHIQKQSDKDLEDALRRVQAVKEAERKNGRLTVSSDEALKYLLYLVDVNRLYDIALGLYDFELVTLVTAKSNKDPKEYLPFLNELRRMEPSYCRFIIDKHLKRYELALGHIAQCPGEEQFKECLDLIKSKKLYAQALDLFPGGSSQYLDIADAFADYLLQNRQYYEAGVMYIRAQKFHKALSAYQLAGDWREALLAAKKLQYKENKLHELYQDLVSRLMCKNQFIEASHILSEYLGRVEESIAVLVKGRLWNEVIWSCYSHDRPDMIETHVKPGIVEHLEQLSSQISTTRQRFNTYKTRLNVVRTSKEKLRLDEKDDCTPEECDIYSDTSSTVGSTFNSVTMGSRTSGRSSRSSKNRRKQERKMLSLKEGSPYEEFALIRALHEVITTANNTKDEVHCLCRILIRFENDKEAARLQNLLSDLISLMDSSKEEIWTSDLLVQPQMEFGPDSTVNNITSKLKYHSQSIVNPGLALLEPTIRFPPQNRNINWKINMLDSSGRGDV